MLAAKRRTSRFSHDTSTGALSWPAPGFDSPIFDQVDSEEMYNRGILLC